MIVVLAAQLLATAMAFQIFKDTEFSRSVLCTQGCFSSSCSKCSCLACSKCTTLSTEHLCTKHVASSVGVRFLERSVKQLAFWERTAATEDADITQQWKDAFKERMRGKTRESKKRVSSPLM